MWVSDEKHALAVDLDQFLSVLVKEFFQAQIDPFLSLTLESPEAKQLPFTTLEPKQSL